MNISEKDIEWTTGTDKPYSEVVRQWWDDFMSENPGKLMHLKHEINSRKKAVDDMKDRYNSMLKRTGAKPAVDLLKGIEAHEKALNALSELYEQHNKTDFRGAHMKEKEIIPESDLWNEAQRLYKENGEKCLSSRDKNYPSSWMKKQLSGETSNLKLNGYERKDKKKENPIRLKSKKIRELLGNNHGKWKYKK